MFVWGPRPTIQWLSPDLWLGMVHRIFAPLLHCLPYVDVAAVSTWGCIHTWCKAHSLVQRTFQRCQVMLWHSYSAHMCTYSVDACWSQSRFITMMVMSSVGGCLLATAFRQLYSYNACHGQHPFIELKPHLPLLWPKLTCSSGYLKEHRAQSRVKELCVWDWTGSLILAEGGVISFWTISSPHSVFFYCFGGRRQPP